MTRNLAPLESVKPDAKPEKLDANLEPLKAGQYWKTSADVPARSEAYQQRVHDWDAPPDAPDRFEERQRVVRDALQGGIVLLVKQLRHDDRGVHTVVLAPHPEWEQQVELRFLASEFYDYFERCFDAQAVRQAERSRVEGKLQNLQQEMIKGPPPAEVPALLEAPAQQSSPSVGAMIQHVKALGDLSTRSQSVIDIAQAHTKFINEKVKEISKTTELLARFYTEYGAASLAAVSDTIAYAEKLAKGVASMGLYTGKGVEVNTWAQGESAPEAEPIYLFQNRIYLEEEFLIHLDDGGMDKYAMDSFISAIQHDQQLRDRILPYPRTVVLARVRRDAKVYNRSSGLAAAFENAMENEQNFTTFLLIRNGENVHQVWSELTIDKAERLFPATDDVNAIFRGFDGSDIAVDDLQYTDKLRDHDNYALLYKRLLILLWGLNDNRQIFGQFYDPNTFRGFFDLSFQQDHFRFIYEDGAKLGTPQPSYVDWFQDMNSHLQTGSRVLVYLPANWNHEQVPGAFSTSRSIGHKEQHSERLTWTGESSQLFIARRQGQEYFIEVQSRHSYYSDKREPVLKLNLRRGVRRNLNDELTFTYLVMDAVKPNDVEFYIQSRTNRVHYHKYMETLLGIREMARQQFELETSMRDVLIAAAADAKLPVPEETTIEQEADTAIRMWRASHRGVVPPSPIDGDYLKACRAMFASLHQLLGAGHNPLDDIPAFLAQTGLVPLRFVLTGKGRYALYVETPLAERETRIHDHVWVSRVALDRTKAGLRELSRKLVIYPSHFAEEKTLKQWEENQGDWPKLSMPDGLTPSKITMMIAAADDGLALIDTLSGKFDWESLYQQFKWFIEYESRTSVVLPMFVVQLGIFATEDDHKPSSGNRKYLPLVAVQGVAALLFKYGSDFQKDRLRRLIRSKHQSPETRLQLLEKLGDDHARLQVWYGDELGQTLHAGDELRVHRPIASNWQDVLRNKDKSYRQVRVSGKWQSRPLRPFENAVPYLPRKALDWINDNATGPDAKIS